MRELTRVLRPGGTMAVTVPRFGPELVNWALSDEYHNVPGGHIRIYRRSVLQTRLRSVGMRVTGHHYAHGLHSPYCGSSAWWAPPTTPTSWSGPITGCWSGTS